MRTVFPRFGKSILILAMVLVATGCAQFREKTALDRYVSQPDPAYTYKLVKSIPGNGYQAYIINLTSQRWRKPSEVNRTLWKHWLVVVKPNHVEHKTGFLFIDGGSNGQPAPKGPTDMIKLFALKTHSVAADLFQVPNEPLTFSDDNVKRSEDGIIAYTWKKYLDGGDDDWPLQLPMTESAVRAMDAVTSFCGTPQGGGVTVDHFVVSGGSKRGWATWLTAAEDPRVVAIMPAVIDMLNLRPSLKHQRQVYGHYSSALDDFVKMGLMKRMDTPRFAQLCKIVDPYSYRARYRMPKYIVNAAGGQYFLPDSSQFYFDKLPGVKYLRYIPNANHSLDGTDVAQTLLAFYNGILTGHRMPRFKWTVRPDGALLVQTTDQPSKVLLWQATNPKARDFRVETIGRVWKSTPLKDQGNGTYIASVPRPPKGFTAYFVELTYPSSLDVPYKFTTGVHITPNIVPHKSGS